MHKISKSKHLEVIQHLQNKLSICQIVHKTGISKSTVQRIAQEVEPNKENLKGGRPKKVSDNDLRIIVHQITTGCFDDATQAT
jgi:transposase